MKGNAQNTPVAIGRFMDRWSLMEEGRKLHDRAVFEIFAKLFTLMGCSKKNHQMAEHGPALKPSLANRSLH
jgi:hypothetical protein